MDYLEDLTVESFAEEVVGYGINEFFKIRHYIFEPNMDVSPYITHVGKAVTVLAILHHRSVNDAMMKVQTKILRSYRTLEIFVNCFAERFFQLRDPYPPRFMLIKILTFCGVIVAMGDFCYRHGRSDFVQVIPINNLIQLNCSFPTYLLK